MSYSVEELFEFSEKIDKRLGGYAIKKYLKKDDPTITELELPAEYKREPVTMIGMYSFRDSRYLAAVTIPGSVKIISFDAFAKCLALETVGLNEGLIEIEGQAFSNSGLKRITLPKSLERLGNYAFAFCEELESAELEGKPFNVGNDVFLNCKKLPIETYIMGLVRSPDITSPVSNADLQNEASRYYRYGDFYRPEIFEFLAKNGNFRGSDLTLLFKNIIIQNVREIFPIAEKYGLLADRELIGAMIKHAVERQTTEITAYLLDLKNRKFNFDDGDKYEL